ncbi:hypothetical protein J5J83_17925 [Azoarcus sp. L1K30]|uniref:hypothetical protein n=1 Tax=Azoarcus sp. L1K30 TaxID=2820277 RepID=UPI001B823B42|nr:hypothetical protein [Azoarcus sp. L1K30]MBR0568004.1 hypothetical protein [Azoarcus sp. L1K30]
MWNFVIYLVVMIVSSMLANPKSTASRASLDEFDLPVPDEGTPQCVIFGDCWTSDWQVLSYGNLRTKPVKSGGGK